MLSADVQAQILAFYFGEKRSARSIAKELDLNRLTVARVIKRRQVVLQRQFPDRRSVLDPFREKIEDWLEKNPTMTASAIFNRIRAEGYSGSLSTLTHRLRRIREIPVRKREAFLRLEFEPGECAQVDWGEFGTLFNDSVKIHAFVMVLCFSRLMYLEFTRSEKFEDFIRCHENAFKYFGGRVPKQCWYDNLATAVTERMGSIVRFNSRFLAYMGHHGIRPHACNPARGNEKGRVEDGIKFIRLNFWQGKEFQNFTDLNHQAAEWLGRYANKREHRSTHRIPRLHFESIEAASMLPMNPHRYDTDEIFSRVVPPNFLIAYESNRYSVPWTLVGLTITLRVTPHEIRIFYHDKFVTSHLRSYQKNLIVEKLDHKQSLLEFKPGAENRHVRQIEAIRSLGPALDTYLDYLKSSHRSLKNEIPKLLALSTIYGSQALNTAAAELLNSGSIGIDALELLLKRDHSGEKKPAPLSFQSANLNRFVAAPDLRKYDALLFDSNHLTAPPEAPVLEDIDPSSQEPIERKSDDEF